MHSTSSIPFSADTVSQWLYPYLYVYQGSGCISYIRGIFSKKLRNFLNYITIDQIIYSINVRFFRMLEKQFDFFHIFSLRWKKINPQFLFFQMTRFIVMLSLHCYFLEFLSCITASKEVGRNWYTNRWWTDASMLIQISHLSNVHCIEKHC